MEFRTLHICTFVILDYLLFMFRRSHFIIFSMITMKILLDSKLVKLSDEVVLLYLAGVWTSHGKEVLVVVMMMMLLLVVMMVVMVMVMVVVILWKGKSHLCYPVRVNAIQCSF